MRSRQVHVEHSQKCVFKKRVVVRVRVCVCALALMVLVLVKVRVHGITHGDLI